MPFLEVTPENIRSRAKTPQPASSIKSQVFRTVRVGEEPLFTSHRTHLVAPAPAFTPASASASADILYPWWYISPTHGPPPMIGPPPPAAPPLADIDGVQAIGDPFDPLPKAMYKSEHTSRLVSSEPTFAAEEPDTCFRSDVFVEALHGGEALEVRCSTYGCCCQIYPFRSR